MKARGLVLVGISGLLGLAAVSMMQKPAAPTGGMAKVVVSKVALNFGDRLLADRLQVVEYPPNAVPPGAFAAVEQIAGPNEDRVVLRAIEPNEPVLAGKISGAGGRAILSTVIDKGMRAVTISVNDVKGVAGFVQPGDRVDVLLTRGPTGNPNAEDQRNDILLQNVKVLAIDQQADDKKDKPLVAKAVTLEVTPEDAQKLTLAGSVGSLSLALRNFANPDPVATRSLSIGDLVPRPPRTEPLPAPRAAAAPHHPQVEILRGTSPTTYEVRRDGAAAPPAAASRSPAMTGTSAIRSRQFLLGGDAG